MLFELIVLLITVLFVYDYKKTRGIQRALRGQGIKGPKTVPLIGSSYLMVGQGPETILDFQQGLIEKYGRTMTVTVLQDVSIMTAEAKMMEAIYSSQKVITKNNLYDLLYSWLGTGLLLSTGKKWFTRRRLITPTFHFKILEQFVEVFDQQSAVMANTLYERADGKTAINMFPVACLAALDIIAETAMGVKINAQKDNDFPYVQSVKIVSAITAERSINPAERFDTWMRLRSPHRYQTLMTNIKAMHDFTDGVIEERRHLLEKSIADGTYKPTNGEDDDKDLGTKKRQALLDVLLQSSTVDGNPLSNADIREEVDTFMFEGHDTTTSGIAFSLYLIARHPAVQQRLFEEIRQVIGDDKDRPVTMRDLNELKYLESVIKESLRLYPPVPIIGRRTQEDVVLNGKQIPANTNIVVLIYNALRDPEYFPQPETFNPDRFGPDANVKIDPFVYTPFSAGPRNCIGQKFAMLEMKSTISKMLRHFELLPIGPDVKVSMNIILRSTTGTHLGIKPRVYA